MSRIANRTAPAERVGEPGAVIRRAADGIELVNLRWGLAPKEEGGRPFAVVRAEGRQFRSRRCLLPASEFFLHRGKGRWHFTLVDRDHFFFAGVWRPASRDWPESYAVLTTEANDDVRPFDERQMAVVLRKDRMAWLDHCAPEADLLRPLPPRSFRVEAEGAPPSLLGATPPALS